MGPAILLDKSAFQKCRKDLLPELYRHYSLVVPPILAGEILEDYAEAPHKFFGLAKRFDPMEIDVTIDYRRFYKQELLGTPVPMEGRPPCVVGKVINTDEGLMHILKESVEAGPYGGGKLEIFQSQRKRLPQNCVKRLRISTWRR